MKFLIVVAVAMMLLKIKDNYSIQRWVLGQSQVSIM